MTVMFSGKAFHPRLHAMLWRHRHDIPDDKRQAIWDMLEAHPDRVQLEIEAAYIKDYLPGDMGPRLEALLEWISENWVAVVQILIALLMLILDEPADTED